MNLRSIPVHTAHPIPHKQHRSIHEHDFTYQLVRQLQHMPATAKRASGCMFATSGQHLDRQVHVISFSAKRARGNVPDHYESNPASSLRMTCVLCIAMAGSRLVAD